MSIRVEKLSRLDLRMGAKPWDFAAAARASIDAHWQSRIGANPKLWNGEVLVCTDSAVADGVLRARFAATDYASLVAWRDWGATDATVRNCFGVPAVISADGALLLGVMGAHTLNPGMAYPPSGSLEPRDVTADGVVDIVGSMHTELAEETGIDAGQGRSGAMLAIFDGHRLAVVQGLHFDRDFAGLAEIFAAHVRGDPEPELAGIEAIRSVLQLDARMPSYAQEIIRQFDTHKAFAGGRQ